MCKVHKTFYCLSCYVNIPKYSKLSGKRLSGKVIVREISCTANNRRVRARRRLRNVLSGKVIVQEKSCHAYAR